MFKTKNERDVHQMRWDLRNIESYSEKCSRVDYDKMSGQSLEDFLIRLEEKNASTKTKKTRYDGRFIIPGEEFIQLDDPIVHKLLSQVYSKKHVERLNNLIDDVMIHGTEESRQHWSLEISYNGLFVLRKKDKEDL